MENLSFLQYQAGQIPATDPNVHEVGQAYNRTFNVLKADTPDLLKQVYQLRYQIYCVENAFENPAEHLDGLEMDIYDSHAIHYLLIHRASNLAVGSVRMVLPVKDGKQRRLPIQSVCPHLEQLHDETHMARASEISRFCISKQIRRRAADTEHHSGMDRRSDRRADMDRRVNSFAILGLIRACIDVVQEHQIDYTYLICEPTLLRLLSKVGVRSTALGPLVEYHGMRQPVLINNDSELLNYTQKFYPDVWSILSDCGRLAPRIAMS